jgi:hypothetical protein
MRIANVAVASAVALLGAGVLGVAACASPGTVTVEQPPTVTSHAPAATPRSAAPTPAVTKTVVRYRSVTTTPTAAAPAAAPATTAAPAAAPAADPNVTDPWAVVSAYYGDIESGDYAGAWALLDSGLTTGQTYQQFVDGFACTGSQDLTETGQSGDTVSFDLAATDDCSGAVQDFSGTDTVQGGLIVGADVSQS